jgi:predicted Zn-dependent protease
MVGAGRARRRGRVWWLAVAAGVLLLGWGGWRLWEVRRHRRAMAEARAEIQAGRHGHAARTLQAIAAGGPGWDEAAYLLGVCEKARGRDQPAADAWGRVPPGSPFAARAVQGLMELQIHRGRLADAERLIERAMADPRIDASALRIFLGLVYSLQGRIEDGQRLVESNWRRLAEAGEGASERAIQLVRLHVHLRQEAASSLEAARAFLDQAGRLAPDDDRVWLGRAHLAIRSGALDEAARWLDACLRRRPEDVAVWRARLDWAMAADRVDEVHAALARLPATGSTEPQVRRLAAWLAARRGDAEAERQALERLVTADPTDQAAIGRLAALSKALGHPARVDELMRRKALADRLDARFRGLDRRNQPTRDAAEMARLAEQLGRPFEAEAFLTLAVAADPDRADLRDDLARLSRSDRDQGRALAAPGRTLARAIAPEVEAPRPTPQ